MKKLDKVKKNESLREVLRYWVNFGAESEQEHYIDCVIEAIVTTYEEEK